MTLRGTPPVDRLAPELNSHLEQLVTRLYGGDLAGPAPRPRPPAAVDGWKEIDVAELSRLPRPIFELWEWQFGGACRDLEPTMFFHPEGERGAARRRRAEAAKAICADCPVIRECREHALRVREPYGVWGGLSEEERLSLVAAVAEVDGMRQAS